MAGVRTGYILPYIVVCNNSQAIAIYIVARGYGIMYAMCLNRSTLFDIVKGSL